MRIAIAATLMLLLACKKESSSPSCGDRVDAFEQALAASSAGTCAADTDCRCFPGGVSQKHGCGGVTDSKTSEKLASIAGDYMKDGCKSGIDCAAWMCTPSCQSGKCTNAPPKVMAPAETAAPSTSTSAAASSSASPEGGVTCAARLAEIDRVLASAPKKCKTEKDCVCFRGGVSKNDACGGITDVKTNERFEALAKQWSGAGCNNEAVMCPAMVCTPACNNGTCGPAGMVVQ
jgi:hypothetical protein